MSVFEKMKSVGVPPNAFTVTSMISACMVVGEVSKARRILDDASQLELTTADLTVIHSSFVSGLNSIITRLHETESNRNNKAAIGSKIRLVFKSLLHILEMDYLSIKPDITALNSLLKTINLVFPSGIQYATELYKAMILDKINPNEFSMSILMTALRKNGYFQEALRVYESVIDLGLVDTAAVNSMLSLCSKSSLPWYTLFIFEQSTSLPSSIISKYMMNDNTINSLYGMMKKYSRKITCSPDVISFTILFQAIGRGLRQSSSSSSPFEYESSEYMQGKTGEDNQLTRANIADIHTSVVKTKQYLLQRNTSTHIGKYIRTFFDEINQNEMFLVKKQGTSANHVQDLSKYLSSEIIRDINSISGMDVESILNYVYRRMRFQYNIIPDARIVSSLNNVFTLLSSDSHNQVGSSDMFGSRWFSMRPYLQDTARLIFEDLVANNFHPNEVML